MRSAFAVLKVTISARSPTPIHPPPAHEFLALLKHLSSGSCTSSAATTPPPYTARSPGWPATFVTMPPAYGTVVSRLIVTNTHGNLRTMATQVELQHRYPESPERIREVLTDPEYLRNKLCTVGGPGAELVWREQDDPGITIILQHSVPRDALPPFLRSVWPDGLTICRIENWMASGASVRAAIDGMPGTITAALHLKSDPTGCVLDTLLTAEVSLPVVGGRIEKMIIDKVAKLIATEYQFTLDWLHDSAIP